MVKSGILRYGEVHWGCNGVRGLENGNIVIALIVAVADAMSCSNSSFSVAFNAGFSGITVFLFVESSAKPANRQLSGHVAAVTTLADRMLTSLYQ